MGIIIEPRPHVDLDQGDQQGWKVHMLKKSDLAFIFKGMKK